LVSNFQVSVSAFMTSLGFGLVSKFEPGLGLGGYGLDFITEHKFLKNREQWKNFEYSVYSLGGDPFNLG